MKFIKHLWFRWKFRKIIGPPGLPGRSVRLVWDLVSLTVVNPDGSFKYVSFARPPGSDYVPTVEGNVVATSVRGGILI